MKIRLFLLIVVCISIVSACGTEDPELDRTDTVAGIDGDDNGIRDDIDAYISRTYTNEEQRKAVNQYAKGLQASLLVDTEDKIAVKAITNEKARAISCISDKIPGGKSPNGERVVREILSMTTNTKLRLTQYFVLDKALDGTVISLPGEDVCDE